MSDKRFSVYFSHSWRPADVDCNQVVWKEICASCNLLVEEDLVEQPPDHVTRLEEYIRRSDLFLAVLPYRADAQIAAGAVGDGAARCSHPALFEIRLAERARKPRFVLYDTRVRFQRGSETGAHVVYQPFEPPHLLQQSGTYVHAAIRTWLNAVAANLEPRILAPNQNALVLLPPSDDRAAVVERIRQPLEDAGFERVSVVPESATDVEVLIQLFASSLVVADVGADAPRDVYAMAHALFVPTIRLIRRRDGTEPSPFELPWLLRGHPHGYQRDLVEWTSLDELSRKVQEHAQAMRDTRKLITEFDVGRDFFERRRFTRRHRVFVSHNLKGPDRPVIDAIVTALEERSISCWEYQSENRAADDWPTRMQEELADATHAVVILADRYETSQACMKELRALLQSRAVILPYFWKRDYPNPDLQDLRLHQEALRLEPAEAADQVVTNLLQKLSPGGASAGAPGSGAGAASVGPPAADGAGGRGDGR
jgi:hypothetical protein